MYKINDVIYLYIKGLDKKKSFKETGLAYNRFGKIVDIKEDKENDAIEYTINIINDKNKNNIMINSVTNQFTFCDMNELIDIISSLDISSEAKSNYIELIDNIVQNKDIEDTYYKFN